MNTNNTSIIITFVLRNFLSIPLFIQCIYIYMNDFSLTLTVSLQKHLKSSYVVGMRNPINISQVYIYIWSPCRSQLVMREL